MSYSSIAWLPLAAGLTVLGIVLSYLAYKRGGWRPGLRGVSWSLLPIAAYMTGAIEMLWKIGAAIGQFGTDFVFSPVKWIGVGVTGLAFALFLASGGRLRRKAARDARKAARGDRKSAAESSPGRAGLTGPDPGTALTRTMPGTRTPVPATPAKPKAAGKAGSGKAGPGNDDDDLKDIEKILRERGI